MKYLIPEIVWTVCEDDGGNFYEKPERITAELEHANRYVQAFRCHISARHWRKLSGENMQVIITIHAITEEILKQGAVITFLNEAGKSVVLPFTYYQAKKAMLFQSFIEEGSVRISIPGNFILGINTYYTFRILVVNARGLKRFNGINWQDFEEAKFALYSENL